MSGTITLLIFSLLAVVEPHHSVKEVARVINSTATPADVIVLEGSLAYSGALPFYTGRRVLLVDGSVDYFSISARLPEARGILIDTGDLIQLWKRPGRVFLVARSSGRSVAAALPAASVYELGSYGARRLYSNR